MKKWLDKLVYVTWVDSSGVSGWRSKEWYKNFATNHDLMCETVGWVVQESADRIATSSTRSLGTDEVNGNEIIPRSAILEVVEIKG